MTDYSSSLSSSENKSRYILLAEQKQQIVQLRTAPIHTVVMAFQNRELLPQLEYIVEASVQDGVQCANLLMA